MKLMAQYSRVAVMEQETRDYTIEGSPRNLDELERMFHWIEELGSVGHSGSCELYVDGDGAARVHFKGLTVEPKKIDEDETPSRGPEIKFGLD